MDNILCKMGKYLVGALCCHYAQVIDLYLISRHDAFKSLDFMVEIYYYISYKKLRNTCHLFILFLVIFVKHIILKYSHTNYFVTVRNRLHWHMMVAFIPTQIESLFSQIFYYF